MGNRNIDSVIVVVVIVVVVVVIFVIVVVVVVKFWVINASCQVVYEFWLDFQYEAQKSFCMENGTIGI